MTANLGLDGGCGGFEGVEAGEQAVYVRDSEECFDAIGQAGDAEGAAVALAGSVGADYAAQTGGVHVGDAGYVQNDGLAGFLAHDLPEIEEGLDGERAGKFQDSGAGGAVGGFDFEGGGGGCHKL